MELPIATYFKWNKPETEREMMKKKKPFWPLQELKSSE